MNINEFVAGRKDEWARLETIIRKFRRGATPNLTQEELWELSRLYTGAVSDLSALKSSELGADPNNEVLRYVNGLVIRVHNTIYRKPPFNWTPIVEFLLYEIPATVRSCFPYVLFSAGTLLFFTLVGFVLTVSEPAFVELLLPDEILQKVEGGDVWFEDLYRVAPMASSFLMTHNITVTFLVVAAGITFGVGTLYLLALNGVLLGAAAGLCYNHSLSLAFWSFVLPHGSLELSAIIIGGAAGLIIGYALVDPGPYRRGDYLAVRAREAGRLAIACVPLLVAAGMIEAFFSPSPLPPQLKIAFAAVLFSLLVIFLITSGANRPSNPQGPRSLPWDYRTTNISLLPDL